MQCDRRYLPKYTSSVQHREEQQLLLLDFVNLSPVTYKLNYDSFPLHCIDYSPISYTQLKCPSKSTS